MFLLSAYLTRMLHLGLNCMPIAPSQNASLRSDPNFRNRVRLWDSSGFDVKPTVRQIRGTPH